MSTSRYLTLRITLPVLYQLKQHVHRIIQSADGFSSVYIITVVKTVQSKMDGYMHIVRCRDAALVAVLDPRTKLFLPYFRVNMEQVELLDKEKCQFLQSKVPCATQSMPKRSVLEG